MEKYNEILRSVELFRDINSDNLKDMFNCFEASTKEVKKDEIVLLEGTKPEYIGIVLAGQLHVIKEDIEGNRALISTLLPSNLFAEALCCALVDESPVSVVAEIPSTIMLLKFKGIINPCSKACTFHMQLIDNMLRIIANKNLFLQSRMDIISIKSIREKVIRYLESFVAKQGRNITIPFNREELANFLCVERSALSHELSRMKRDGIIDYNKNKFILLS